MSSIISRNKEFAKVDWITLATFISLVVIGWMMIYASGYSELTDSTTPFFRTNAGKQLIAIIISAFAFLLVFITDFKFWSTLSYPIYLVGLLLLVMVLFFGQKIKGSTSWFNLGGFSFQPSEFAKFGTMLAMAAYLSYFKTNLKQFKSRLIAMMLFAVPIGLILMQPDAGSAITFGSFFILLFREGFNPVWYIIGLALLALFILALKFDPLYVIAYILAGGSTQWPAWLIWALIGPAFFTYFYLIYFPKKQRVEGDRLERRFGEEYARFRREVPPFLPALRRWAHAEREPWSLKTLLSNHELEMDLLIAVLFAALWLPGRLF